MKRLLVNPGLSAALLVTWLALNDTIAPAHLVLGAILATAVPLLIAPFLSTGTRSGRPVAAFRLFVRVIRDIVIANVEVALRILGPERAIRPGFVWVPLDLRDPRAVRVLAGIITLTPGTLSADLSDDGRHLLVHALHLTDADELIRAVKSDYETPLRVIFEGTASEGTPE